MLIMDTYNHINRLPLVFRRDQGKSFFQFHINGELASLEYTMEGSDSIVLGNLEISKYLNGPEVKNALIERVMEYIQRAEYIIVRSSPEIRAFLKKRPCYQNLVVHAQHPLMDKKPLAK
jgi:predicted GNAT family acetyltransferase